MGTCDQKDGVEGYGSRVRSSVDGMNALHAHLFELGGETMWCGLSSYALAQKA